MLHFAGVYKKASARISIVSNYDGYDLSNPRRRAEVLLKHAREGYDALLFAV
jgi:hypothetical protein